MSRPLLLYLVPAILLLPLLACHPLENKKAAESAVTKFHAQLDAEQFHEIYAASSHDFQQASNEPDMTALFQAIHRKLGPIHKSDEAGFFVNYTTGGTMITLTYSTQFASGSGQEQFIWRMEDGQPALVGYHINSKELITR